MHEGIARALSSLPIVFLGRLQCSVLAHWFPVFVSCLLWVHTSLHERYTLRSILCFVSTVCDVFTVTDCALSTSVVLTCFLCSVGIQLSSAGLCLYVNTLRSVYCVKVCRGCHMSSTKRTFKLYRNTIFCLLRTRNEGKHEQKEK